MKYLKDVIYIILIIVLSTFLILSHLDDNFNILTSSDWVNLVIGIFSATATILLGIIAVYQNKKAHDINDRLLNIEEFNNKTFLYFENAVVPIKLMSDEYWSHPSENGINETVHFDIMNDLDEKKDNYLFVPKCQFFGKIPARKIIINGYSIKKISRETGNVISEKTSNKKIVNDVQCCKENVVYEGNIGLDFNGVEIETLSEENAHIVISINVEIQNIMGILNKYDIEIKLSKLENEDNFFFMISNIIDKK